MIPLDDGGWKVLAYQRRKRRDASGAWKLRRRPFGTRILTLTRRIDRLSGPHHSDPNHPLPLIVFSGVTANVGLTNLRRVSDTNMPNTRLVPPVRMVDLQVLAQEILLPRLVGPIPPYLIPIFLRLQHRDQMDPRPHLLACQFPVQIGGKKSRTSALFYFSPRGGPARRGRTWRDERGTEKNLRIHLFAVALSDLVESVCHDHPHGREVVHRPEPPHREIALFLGGSTSQQQQQRRQQQGQPLRRWRGSCIARKRRCLLCIAQARSRHSGGDLEAFCWSSPGKGDRR